MPPRNNGDYAWLQQVAESLKDDGKAIIVMSQGVLFRGQPEQTEEEDGQNQKAGAEYVIREGFVKADIIECVIVLPPKLFYGNSVPACLIVLNKNKPPDRKNKILMIWASRHLQKANPQNLLRPSDLMRILVPWRAFGDLAKAQELVAVHERKLLNEEEAERRRRLQDIDDAYTPILEPLEGLTAELVKLEGQDWKDAGYSKKADYSARVKDLRHQINELQKIQAERDKAEVEVNEHTDREIAHIREAAADLLRICSNAEEAARYFTVGARSESEENEFNLNLPRYVDTFEPEEEISLQEAMDAFHSAENAYLLTVFKLKALFNGLNTGGGTQ
jgi:type I restriction enzyme M protein